MLTAQEYLLTMLEGNKKTWSQLSKEIPLSRRHLNREVLRLCKEGKVGIQDVRTNMHGKPDYIYQLAKTIKKFKPIEKNTVWEDGTPKSSVNAFDLSTTVGIISNMDNKNARTSMIVSANKNKSQIVYSRAVA